MKKLFYFAAAAVALAACAKNEVIPVNSGENQEITFNVAPKTKATTTFDKNFKFKAWAYYLPGTVKWDERGNTTPELYIDGAVIANTNPTGTDGVWKAEDKTSYYWPKNGSLTFFAYSLNKTDLSFKTVATTEEGGSHVTCATGSGIYAVIDLSVDKNVDFLVADIKADQTANTTNTGENGKYYNDGVPTLFRHRLSYVAFNVKTLKDYSKEGKRLDLKSITFNKISSYGEYRQVAAGEAFPSGFKASDDAGHVGTVSYTRIPMTESPFTMEIKSSNTGSGVLVSDTDNYLYIPQTFAKGSNANQNAYIEVKYTITTKVGKDEHNADIVVKEDVTKQIFLNPADGTKMFDKWEMGKKYTINLTFTLDEILWDPAVQEWEDVIPAAGYDVK